jgi:hypothetical protein
MEMKKCMLMMLLACNFAGAKSQNLKLKGDSLAAAYGYLFKVDSVPASAMLRIMSSQDQWKGRKMDAVGQFDAYQLPTDRMICLVPNKSNPARSNVKIVEPGNGRGHIPNAIKQSPFPPTR